MAIINGTKGTHGTNGASPTAGGKGSNEAFTQNGKIGADSITQQVFGGEGGDGGNNSNPLALGGMGGAGGNATITFNGNIFNAPATNTLLVTLTATGGNGGAGGTGTPAGAQGVGGNGTVTMNGNIVQPNKVMGAIELDAIAVGGNGSRKGNASATVNGNIIQPSKGATSVTLKALASNTFDSFTHDGDLAYGIKTATLNGNIVQGNINNVYLQASATPSNGTATVNGNIVQVNTNTVAATTVTLDVSGNHIAVTNNKITLGKQEFDFTINKYTPYDDSISGNEFKGSGTNAFVFTDNAIPGPHHDTVSINLGTGTFVFNGQSNILTGFSSVTVAGNGVNASLTGGPGDDTLIGGDGDDIIDGGGGNDVIYGGKGNDILTGGQGNDILHGNDGDDVLDGGAGNDQLFGGAGDDILIVSTGTDLLDGMTDPLGDTVDFRNASSGVTANLGGAQQNFTTSYGGITTLTTLMNIQNINGSAFGDTLTGDNVANTLNGGAGNDRLTGGQGDDTLDGGNDIDTAVYSGTFLQYAIAPIAGGITVTDSVPGRDGTDTVKNVEFLEFSNGTYNVGTATFVPNGPANTPPVANTDAYATNEDTALVVGPAGGVLVNDTDAELNPLTAAVVTGPAHGALTLNANGSFTYTPTANYNGADSFTYKANDGLADSNVATVNLTVNAVNDAPAGTNNTVVALEDGTYAFTAADFGFTDPNDSPANTLQAVTITTLPAAGTLKLGAVAVTAGQSIAAASIPSLTFTPAANGNGNGYASFTFQVQDNGGVANGGIDLDQSPNTITVNVTSVNDAPAGTNGTVSALEDVPYAFTAADFGFTDPNDSPANSLQAVTITSLPASGTLKLGAVAVTAGQSIAAASIPNLTFTPAANASGNGYASFTFQVQDNGGTANGGIDLDPSPNTITVNVTPVNDAPAGTNNTVAILEDGTYTFAASDFGFTDPNDSPANSLQAVTITTLPLAGTLKLGAVAVTAGQSIALAAIPSLTYTPAANGNGAPYSSFTFQVQDNGGTANGGVDLDQSPNSFTFNVTAVNDAPVAVGDSYAVNEDGVLNVPATGVLGNDTDAENDPLTSILVSGPAHGLLTLNPNGSFTYTPNANYFGADSFTYKANDGLLDSGNATVNITVNPVNDAPVAVADSYATDFNTTLIVPANGVLGNDTDIDGDTLHVSAIITGPAHGILTPNADGSFTYTPDNGYVGGDSFSYTANDGTVDSNIATVSLTVNGGQTFPGTPGNDTLTGTNFDDVFYVTTGTDTIDGGPNGPLGDTVVFTNASSGVNANLGPAQQNFTASFGGTPTLTTLANIENLTGSNFNDTLTGDGGNNTVSGGTGDDILVASAGTDVLDGGTNTPFGDTADFRDATSGVNVNLGGAQQDFTANGLGLVTLTNIENLTGSSHDDLLTGDAGANRLDGGAGTDKVLYATQPVASDIGWNGTAFTVSNFGGTDTLVNIEQVDDAAQAGAKILLVGAGGYATINAAIAAANAGDTILIAPGTYNENVVIGAGKDGLTLQAVAPGVSIRGTFDTENAAHGFMPGDQVSTFLETHGYDVVGVGDGITVSSNNVTLSGLTVEYFNNAVATTTGAISGLTLDGVTMQHSVMGFAKPDGSETTGLTITGSTISDTYIGVYLYNDNFALDATSQAIDTTITNTLFQNIAQKGIYAETAQGNTLVDGLTLDNVGEYGGGPGFGAQGLNGNGIQFNLKFHTYVGNLDISNFTLTNVGSSDGLGTPHAGGGAIVVEGRDDPTHPTYGVHPADVSGLIVNVSNGTIDGTSVGIRAGEANKANPSLNVSGPNVTVTNVTIANASQGEIDNHTQSGLMTVEGTNGDDVYRSNQTLVSSGALLLNGYGGNDTLTGGAGNDILDGGTGDDILDGGLSGTDTALYTDATQNGLTVNLSAGTASGGGLGNDTLYNITNVFGSAFNDTLVGDYNDNLLAGNDGNDILYGRGGTNLLVGGDGTDVAYYAGLETDYAGPTTSAVTGGAESVDDTLSSVERLKFLSPTHVSDVDNNGKGDQITQETATGNLTINQQLVGTINVSGVLLGGANWKAIGTGQFDPDVDRTSDILLQDSSTGDLEVLTDLAGTPTVTALSAQPGSANWKAIATGDFNGDAASDILLQNSATGATQIMFLNTNAGDGFLVLPDAPGTVASTNAITGPAAGTAWKAIATGDFNADGKSDIVWQNSTTKQVQVYLMDGATRLNTPVSQAASGLTAIGTGDFNGDGNSDILFQNASGQAVIWFMNGAVHTGNKTIAKPTAAAWSVSGAEDVDGNGYSDIIWTDASGNAAATKLGGPSSLTSTTVMNSNFGLTPAAGGFHFIASTGG